MYSFKTVAAAAGVLLCLSGACFGQTDRNSEMTARINALKARLKNFTIERAERAKKVGGVVSESYSAPAFKPQNEQESVEISYERLVEEFESRPDVAMTVLFHDQEVKFEPEPEPEPEQNIAFSESNFEKINRRQECQRLLNSLRSSIRRGNLFTNESTMLAQADTDCLL